MFVDKGLLFKALGLCGLCAGSTVLYFKGGDLKTLLSSGSGKKKVWEGLECDEPTPQGGNCELKKKIFVKRETNTSSFELTTLGEGKIKVYKVAGEGENTYQDGFKFLIEDNDIGSDPNKLEEFESYEIKLGTDTDEEALKGKHYLSRKTESKEEIKKALGLSCELPDSGSQDCTISENKVGSVAISGGTVTLTISKEATKTEFPLGYKFTFKNTVDANATLTFGGTPITLKKNSPVDFKIKKEGSSLSLEKAWTLEELTKKVGLKKDGEEGYWFVGNPGMNVKVDESTKKTNLIKYYDPAGRVKIYEEEAEYNEGLRFTIEKGDLDLNDVSGQNTKSYTLGQFQSFEIVKDSDGNWYLSKKEGDEAKVKKELGLPCDLPTETTTPKECSLTNDNIKTIKFDGKGEGDTTYTGTPKLTIHKETGRYDYPLGYKFVFSSESDSTITIPSGSPITLRSNLSYDYKIKRSGADNQTLSLERAWTPKVLMEKEVGFAEGSKENGWNKIGKEGISIKQDTHKASSAKASGEQKAKIKVYEEVPGYNQGMKFVVEEGDTNLTNGNNINKLSKYETYEISKNSDDSNWYFNRKKKSDESIRELLGLPEDFSMPTASETSKECTLDSTKLNGIKFEGKGDSASATITESGNNITLKISKENSGTEFPLGYKFTFSSEQTGFTVPKSNGNIEVKKGTNTEFKIKEAGSTLTLEKAWTAESLGKKVKLSCTGNENKCSFGEKINVWDENNNYVDEATITNSSSHKLVYELDQEGYNQGIKFSVDGDSDIEISGSSGSETKPTKICKKNGSDGAGETNYQIMEKTVGGTAKWYLVKKSN